MGSSAAVCPAGISSFFEICARDSSGNEIAEPERVGARGGGFAIKRGVRATVKFEKSNRAKIEVKIRKHEDFDPITTRWAVERLLTNFGLTGRVRVDLDVQVPIGAGFGTSAAGTAAACLALAEEANLSMSFNELGKLTHVAEVVNRTGLGTAAALFVGGFVLVTEPGAPGIGQVDRLLFPREHSIVCAYLEPISTSDALRSGDMEARVNGPARRIMEAIRREPDLQTFLQETGKFGEQSGFATPEVVQIRRIMLDAGSLGGAQNMIGKAVHAVVEDSLVRRVVSSVKKKFPKALVFVSSLDTQGVRIVS